MRQISECRSERFSDFSVRFGHGQPWHALKYSARIQPNGTEYGKYVWIGACASSKVYFVLVSGDRFISGYDNNIMCELHLTVFARTHHFAYPALHSVSAQHIEYFTEILSTLRFPKFFLHIFITFYLSRVKHAYFPPLIGD